MSPRHVFEEHVGEVQLHVEASTLPELFAEAAHALTELFLGEGKPSSEAGPPELVSVRARDRDGLLVEWLNELIFRAETTGRACVRVDVQRLTDTDIDALVHEQAGELVAAVKAATYHDVHVRPIPPERGGGFEVTVILDS